MTKEVREITIRTDYITLGQLLKYTNIIFEGGDAKEYLSSHEVLVNDEKESRRGRKIRGGDSVELQNVVLKISHE